MGEIEFRGIIDLREMWNQVMTDHAYLLQEYHIKSFSALDHVGSMQQGTS